MCLDSTISETPGPITIKWYLLWVSTNRSCATLVSFSNNYRVFREFRFRKSNILLYNVILYTKGLPLVTEINSKSKTIGT